jgi:hypothetical protein
MRRTYLCWVVFCLALSAGTANAGGLNGDLTISKEPLTDPLPDGDKVAYLSLRGKDAKKIYNEMNSQDYPNACNIEGVTARVAGNLICYKGRDNNYLCNFGVRLTDGWLVLGKPC